MRSATAPTAAPRIVERMPWKLLAPHLARALRDDAARTALALEKLRLYATRLIEWNTRVSNLISANDEPRLVERHLLESLEPAAWLLESGAKRWLDFGSGAGFPALPLAMVGVGEQWMLVESRRPKTLFLQKMVEELELPHVEIFHARLEVMAAGDDHPVVEAITSRATMRIAPTLEIGQSIVRSGGYAFLWKGSGWQEEMAAAANSKATWALEDSKVLGSGPTSLVKIKRL
jgi:16S rRNA (guanine527-N7)-methyltransferase